MLVERIHNILAEKFGFEPGQRLVVAVSGGPDSLALLHGLHQLEFSLLPVHLDHMLRPTSGKEAAWLEDEVAGMGLSLISGKVDVSALAREKKMSIEEAARESRYRFLFEQAGLYQARAIIVGHTADDQVETLLMHLLRGAGTMGLQGMQIMQTFSTWDASIPIVRPLLNTWRHEIESYCQEQSLQPIKDESNSDAIYFRNRIRNELIPILEKSYNPAIKKALFRLSKIVRGDAQIIQDAVEQSWLEMCLEEGATYIRLNLEKLKSSPAGMQRNLARKAILSLSEEEDAGFDLIESITEFISADRPAELHLPGELMLIRWMGELILIQAGGREWLRRFPQIRQAIRVDAGQAVALENEWRLHAQLLSECGDENLSISKRDPFSAVLNPAHMHFPLIVRPPRPGDRVKPYGLEGHSQKLSDYFINHKLPRLARERYPVVCSGDEIVWVPGYQIAHGFQLEHPSCECVLLRMQP